MTCGLHGKLETAIAAAKEALTAALDGDFEENVLEDILAAYSNLKSVGGRVKHTDTGITFVPDTTLGDAITFNDDITINTDDISNGTVTFGADYAAGLSSDVITFPDDMNNDV
jgi:hypothetical protein|tara:strand:+ start:2141 stop:2479 length:339 start_codon:yes stop_codon:yes gene_type:complete